MMTLVNFSNEQFERRVLGQYDGLSVDMYAESKPGSEKDPDARNFELWAQL